MKFVTKVLLLFFLSTQIVLAASIVIDAGHGGKDPGAHRQFNGVHHLEKNLTLSISRHLSREFKKRGHDVVMTRDNDTFLSLGLRLAKGRRLCQNAFISIHVDATPLVRDRATGATVYVYPNASKRNRQIAQAAQQALNPKRRYKTARIHVLRPKQPSCVSILVETGYINNESDLTKLIKPRYQKQISSKLAQSIISSLAKYNN